MDGQSQVVVYVEEDSNDASGQDQVQEKKKQEIGT